MTPPISPPLALALARFAEQLLAGDEAQRSSPRNRATRRSKARQALQ